MPALLSIRFTAITVAVRFSEGDLPFRPTVLAAKNINCAFGTLARKSLLAPGVSETIPAEVSVCHKFINVGVANCKHLPGFKKRSKTISTPLAHENTAVLAENNLGAFQPNTASPPSVPTKLNEENPGAASLFKPSRNFNSLREEDVGPYPGVPHI